MCLKQIFDCKKINKYTSYPKINQNLALKNLCCFRQTQKVLKSMANLFVTFCPNAICEFPVVYPTPYSLKTNKVARHQIAAFFLQLQVFGMFE